MFKKSSRTKTYLVILVLCSPTILSKLQGILADYKSLLQKAEIQRKCLQEQFQLYQFEREFQLVAAWLSSKQSVAESDDYGQDLDDVEVKEKKRYCMYCVAKQEYICCRICVAADNEVCYGDKS